MGQLGLGPRVVGRLGSVVWVSGTFQILALTAGEGGEGNNPGGGISGWYMSEGQCSRENVLHSPSTGA